MENKEIYVMLNAKAYSLFANVLALLLLLMMVRPSRVLACSCAYDPNLTEEERLLENYQHAHHEIVFVGRVIKTKLYQPNSIEYSPDAPVYVTFAVQTVYKGDPAPEFTLSTSGDGGSCGYDFAPGESYLVFVGDDFKDGSWNSGLCSGNELNPSASLLAVLGEGAPPAADGDFGETWPEAEAAIPKGHLLPSYSCLGSGAVLLVVGTAVLFWAQPRTKRK